MRGTHAEFKAVQSTAVALARLEDSVRAEGAQSVLSTLLILRSAQAIVAREDRLSANLMTSAESAFAALIGHWFGAASREFVAVDETLVSHASALHTLSLAVAKGAPLGEAVGTATPAPIARVIADAATEEWGALELAAALASGECAAVGGSAADVARALSLVGGDLLSGAYLVAPSASAPLTALQQIAREARVMQRRVEAYRASCLSSEARCAEFGRGGPTARGVVELLQQRGALTVADVVSAVRVATPTAGAALERLTAAGVVREVTGRGRDRLFVYAPAVALAG